MAGNPNPSPDTRLGGPRAPAHNAGGRTPTKWLREFLDAARDKGNGDRRSAIAEHLFELATSYEVKVKGHGEDAIPLADAKDSIAAATLLLAYDMGKPTESIEVESPNGTMSPPSIEVVLTRTPTEPEAVAHVGDDEPATD